MICIRKAEHLGAISHGSIEARKPVQSTVFDAMGIGGIGSAQIVAVVTGPRPANFSSPSSAALSSSWNSAFIGSNPRTLRLEWTFALQRSRARRCAVARSAEKELLWSEIKLRR